MGCAKTTKTSADCQPARRYAKSPWLRHTQRVVLVCGPDIITNTGSSSTSAQSTAAHQFCLTCLTSLTSPTNAPHRTLMQNQTAIQYWGAGLSVIPLAASDYRTIRPFSSTGGKKKNLSNKCEPKRRHRSLKGSKKKSRHRATRFCKGQ